MKNSKNRVAIHGFMLDAARLMETTEYYRTFIDFFSQWEINTLIFRLTDDQGCALKFPSHPELICKQNALTVDEMRELVQYAKKLNIQMIPEIESLGHCSYITQVPAYSHLDDTGPDDPEWATGLPPLHKQTMAIFKDLYREALDIFNSPYLHAGCDETNWGSSAHSLELLQSNTRSEIFARHINALQQLAACNDARLIVWGDHVLREHPEILDYMDKRVIIHDWEYNVEKADEILPILQRATNKGFEIIGGPALMWSRWTLRPGIRQLNNITAYTKACQELPASACCGVIITNWAPGRFLGHGIWDALAISSQILNDRDNTGYLEQFRIFVQVHFGSEWSADWELIFNYLYHDTPCRVSFPPRSGESAMPPVCTSDKELQKIIQNPTVSGYKTDFSTMLKTIASCRALIKHNTTDFDDIVLNLEIFNYLQERNRQLVNAFSKPTEQRMILLENISINDQHILQRLNHAWAHGREHHTMEIPNLKFGMLEEEDILPLLQQAYKYISEIKTTQ